MLTSYTPRTLTGNQHAGTTKITTNNPTGEVRRGQCVSVANNMREPTAQAE